MTFDEWNVNSPSLIGQLLYHPMPPLYICKSDFADDRNDRLSQEARLSQWILVMLRRSPQLPLCMLLSDLCHWSTSWQD